MAEQQIAEYIRKSQTAGVVWGTIRQDLISAGWDPEKVDEAYQDVNIPKPPVPVPPPATDKKSIVRKRYTSPYSILLGSVLVISLLILAQNAVTDLLNHFAPIDSGFRNSAEYEEYFKDKPNYEREMNRQRPLQENYLNQDDYNRAYSDWSQKRYSYEGSEFYNRYFSKYQVQTVSPSFRMILHAFLVLPFWIITFLLSVSLREDRKRHEALLGAYYVTSGWLLIFLFFNIAKYIYDSNSTLGVYVSFGMLALILTGAIWGIQRYRHNYEN